MEKSTIKLMIEAMDKTREEIMSEILVSMVKLVNKKIKFGYYYTASCRERRAA